MTWRSTLKAKAREYVMHHYLLGSHQSSEDKLANARELVHGAMFVRDGVDEDVCPYLFALDCTALYFTGYNEEHGVSSAGRPYC